jgi:hypothetical protein
MIEHANSAIPAQRAGARVVARAVPESGIGGRAQPQARGTGGKTAMFDNRIAGSAARRRSVRMG